LGELKFLDAMILFKNIESLQNLFLFFFEGPYSPDNIMSIDLILIGFSEKCEQAQKYYDSLNKIKNYWEVFFKNEKLNEKIKLTREINEYENCPLDKCKSLKKEIYNSLVKEADQGEKFMDSIFFMGIFEEIENKFGKKDKERYDYSLKKFEQLKELGNDSDVNSLDDELKQILIISIYKNKDRLNDELNFIKTYFDFNKQSKNFNPTKIKRSFIDLVNKYKKENKLGDYVVNMDDILVDMDDNKDKKGKINEINQDKKIIVDDIKKDLKTSIMEGKNKLINDMQNLGNEYYLLAKKCGVIDDRDNNMNENQRELRSAIYSKFKAFYEKLFDINYGFGSLEDTEFYHNIICLTKQIYMNASGLGLINFNEGKIIIIASEFNEIMEAFENQKKITKNSNLNYKKFLLPLMKIMNSYKMSDDKDILNNLEELFYLLKNTFKNENIYLNLFNNVLVKEKQKFNILNLNEQIINLIFKFDKNKYEFLNEDVMPIPYINEVFSDAFNLDLKQEDLRLNFETNQYLKKINELCGNKEKKNFSEMILFYFETKVIKAFELYQHQQNLQNRYQIYGDDRIKRHFRSIINKLGEATNGNIRYGNLIKLYCISFIKFFLSDLINSLIKNANNMPGINDIINFIKGSSTSEIRTTLKIYVLKLIYDNKENFFDFRNFNFEEAQINFITDEDIDKYLNKEKWNLYLNNNKKFGFDYIFTPIKEKEELAPIMRGLLEIKKNNNNEYDDSDLINCINKNNDIDLLFCGLSNIYFSFYYFTNYYTLENSIFIKEKENINNWILKIIENKEIKLLEENEILTEILLLFVNQKTSENKINIPEIFNGQNISYNELLSLLIAARFVLNTVSLSNEDSLFYRIVTNPQDIIYNYENYLKCFLNDFEIFNKEQRDICYLTYKFIKYIIFSHLYFGCLLKKIKLDDEKLLSIVQINSNDS
jgi:hypothetical protein